MVTLVRESRRLIVGVDSHKEIHQAAVLDENGVLLGNERFAASTAGYRELEAWLATLGEIDRVGMECTGSYAAGLTRFFRERDVEVLEVNSTHRAVRARRGKDDPIDAEMAARKVLSGEARALAKDTTGAIESIRLLKVARDSAIKSRLVALLQIRDVLVTAPAELREHIDDAGGTRHRVNRAASLRPDVANLDSPLQAAKFALRDLARRVKLFDDEIKEIDVCSAPSTRPSSSSPRDRTSDDSPAKQPSLDSVALLQSRSLRARRTDSDCIVEVIVEPT
jgi:transposase